MTLACLLPLRPSALHPLAALLIGRARVNVAQRLPLQSRRIIGRGISKCWPG